MNLETGSLRIQRKSLTLREKAADVLRQAIIDHRFPPGTHLIERELCEMLGVSRTSVREALRHLESEQLIVMTPHKGPVVATLTVRDAENLYLVRASLEGLAGELFALRATDAQIIALGVAAKKMEPLSGENSTLKLLDAVSGFYRILMEGAQNSVCEQFIFSLNSRISILRRMSLASSGRHDVMMEEVNAIIQAAEERNPQKLKQACIDHVDGASKAALEQLRKNEEG